MGRPVDDAIAGAVTDLGEDSSCIWVNPKAPAPDPNPAHCLEPSSAHAGSAAETRGWCPQPDQHCRSVQVVRGPMPELTFARPAPLSRSGSRLRGCQNPPVDQDVLVRGPLVAAFKHTDAMILPPSLLGFRGFCHPATLQSVLSLSRANPQRHNQQRSSVVAKL